MMSKFNHFFLLSPSPWPILISLNCFSMFISLVMFFKMSYMNSIYFSLLLCFWTSMYWWISYSTEMNTEGSNSTLLEDGIKFGMILFISSEVLFFFSFFWSYFHFFLSPSLDLGLSWPPYSLEMFDFLSVPLINTIILLSSGVSLTISHYYIINGYMKLSILFLLITILLGLLFSTLQVMEYFSSFFSISDSTFGTSFFVLTGFHGLHVLIGTFFLSVVMIFNFLLISSKDSFLSFELASWYWHFVDVVWIMLYFCIYYLSN